MKVITFSLWGVDPKYLIGAIKNAKLAESIYPGWVCRFYVDALVPTSIVSELESIKNTQVFRMNEVGDWRGMFWRFVGIDDDSVEIMISRDADSRLNLREKAAVEEWVASDKGFHIMRDHPYHKFPVLGGMWGVKSGVIPNMGDLVNKWDQQDAYGTDYEFFADAIIPLIGDNVMVHDEFFEKNPFPVKRKNLEFVGQVFDRDDNTVKEHVEALRRAIDADR